MQLRALWLILTPLLFFAFNHGDTVSIWAGLMEKTLLSLSTISKQFEGKTVLDSLTLDIFDGEFITLLGPSGCGKTTLLRMMAGFELPDNGTVTLAGVDITDQPPEQRPLNTVFQSYALFPHMSVYDNVAYGLKMEKRPTQHWRSRDQRGCVRPEAGAEQTLFTV